MATTAASRLCAVSIFRTARKLPAKGIFCRVTAVLLPECSSGAVEALPAKVGININWEAFLLVALHLTHTRSQQPD